MLSCCVWNELSCVQPSVGIPAPVGMAPQPGPATRAPRGKLQTGSPYRPQPRGWGGQRQAELQQQMHRELCTLTPCRHLCSVLGQIPQNTPGSASLETETCATSPLHFPTCILQHLLKSSVENSPFNPAVCAGPLSKGFVYSRDYR